MIHRLFNIIFVLLMTCSAFWAAYGDPSWGIFYAVCAGNMLVFSQTLKE